MSHRFLRTFGLLLVAVSSVAAAVPAEEETLTLDQCVSIALNRNNEVVQSRLQLKMFARDELSAFSRFLPSLSGNLGYNHSVLGPSSKFRIDPRTGIPVPLQPAEIASWGSSAGFSGQQMFFDGTSIFGFARAASLKSSAQATDVDTRQAVILKVKEAYYNLLKKEKLLQAQEETFRQWEESYKRVEMMHQVGKVPKSDLLKAKVELETSRLGVLQAGNDVSIAGTVLNHTLGYSVERRIRVMDDPAPSPEPVDYEAALDKALAAHPMLRKGHSDVSASKAGIGAAASAFLPSVYGFGGYSWRNEKFDRIEDMFNTDYNWYVGVSLSVPIFQGFSRVADVSKARLQLKSSREALEQTRRDVSLLVRQGHAEVTFARQQMTVTRDAEAAAQEDLRLNQEKYDLGSGTMLELITAQAAFTTHRNNRIQADYDYRIATARLEKAMGVLK